MWPIGGCNTANKQPDQMPLPRIGLVNDDSVQMMDATKEQKELKKGGGREKGWIAKLGMGLLLRGVSVLGGGMGAHVLPVRSYLLQICVLRGVILPFQPFCSGI